MSQFNQEQQGGVSINIGNGGAVSIGGDVVGLNKQVFHNKPDDSPNANNIESPVQDSSSSNKSNWNKDLRKQFYHCLLGAYSYDSLKRMLLFELDKKLEYIVASSNLQTVVVDLILVAENEGWITQLVEKSAQFVPNNSCLAAVVQKMHTAK